MRDFEIRILMQRLSPKCIGSTKKRKESHISLLPFCVLLWRRGGGCCRPYLPDGGERGSQSPETAPLLENPTRRGSEGGGDHVRFCFSASRSRDGGGGAGSVFGPQTNAALSVWLNRKSSSGRTSRRWILLLGWLTASAEEASSQTQSGRIFKASSSRITAVKFCWRAQDQPSITSLTHHRIAWEVAVTHKHWGASKQRQKR